MSTRLERWAPTATKTASKPPSSLLGDEVLDPVLAGHPHAQRRDPVELAVEHVAGQPVGRDAVAHHPAGLGAGVPDLDLVAEPGQVVGGREPARARRRSRAPACRCGPVEGRTASPARARGRRGSARPSGSRRRCRGRRGCRRSRTGGSRRVRGSRAADCRRRAARHACSCRPAWVCDSQAWMFSPAGQPALQGGSRST